MKSSILNLIATATLLFCHTAQAADEMPQQVPPAAETSAVPITATPETSASAATEQSRPSVKPSKSYKRAKSKQVRSKSLDLRHCLELTTYVEIAQCADE